MSPKSQTAPGPDAQTAPQDAQNATNPHGKAPTNHDGQYAQWLDAMAVVVQRQLI